MSVVKFLDEKCDHLYYGKIYSLYPNDRIKEDDKEIISDKVYQIAIIYGTKGYIICNGTLAQEEVGTLSYLYSPQGGYDAAQSRIETKPRKFKGRKSNLYLKQINDFCKQINSGKINYSYAEKAVHVQEIVDRFYKNN